MRLVRYQAAGGTGIGAVRPDGSVVTTPWPDFGALFAEPDPLRAAQAPAAPLHTGNARTGADAR